MNKNRCGATKLQPCGAPQVESETFDQDTLHEECGVFGIWSPTRDVSRLTFFGLQALQHRGQESAGIAVTDGVELTCEKGLGLAREVFTDEVIDALQGIAASGHVRYSTSGKDPEVSLQMAHPFVAMIDEGASADESDSESGGESSSANTNADEENTRCPRPNCFALAHNGTLTNSADMLAALGPNAEAAAQIITNSGPHPASDSQIATHLLAHYASETENFQAAIERMMHLVQGAYSMVVLTPDALFTMRDFSGIRPLCLGKFPDDTGWVVASETCAFDLVGAEYVRDVAPGEVIRIDADGLHATQLANTPKVPARPAACLFEYVYFARPDSVIDGANVYRAREAMGRRLSHEAPIEADIVIGVPDSGIPAAIGYARESGIVYSEGLIKNRYVDRTFIQPTQELREQGIRIKLNPLHYAVRNRRIIVVDDSIVRGSTSKQLVQMLRDAGAAEVHLRITSPAIVWPCFLGINTDTQEQLIAATQSVEEIRDFIGADSLAYLSLEGLKSCIYAEHPEYCTACFDGIYPMPHPNPLHADAFLPNYTPTWTEV